jgi:hypothetical protein
LGIYFYTRSLNLRLYAKNADTASEEESLVLFLRDGRRRGAPLGAMDAQGRHVMCVFGEKRSFYFSIFGR